MKADAQASFGAQLKALREAAGFTQEELATIAGLSVHAVSALERGERRKPHVETVRALSSALDLTGAIRDALIASARRTAPVAERDQLRDGSLPWPLQSFSAAMPTSRRCESGSPIPLRVSSRSPGRESRQDTSGAGARTFDCRATRHSRGVRSARCPSQPCVRGIGNRRGSRTPGRHGTGLAEARVPHARVSPRCWYSTTSSSYWTRRRWLRIC